MFIKTQDERNLIELTGSVKIGKPITEETNQIILCNKNGYYVLGTYDNEDYAKNALNALALAIACKTNLFIMPEHDFTDMKLLDKVKDIQRSQCAA